MDWVPEGTVSRFMPSIFTFSLQITVQVLLEPAVIFVVVGQ